MVSKATPVRPETPVVGDDAHALRPAGVATRDAISEAARELFGERGFAQASVRAIAARAEVDPALVIRHFGSKEALFLTTIAASSRLPALVAGPLSTLGRRLAEFALSEAGADTRQTTVALIQASYLPHVREEMQGFGDRVFIQPLAERLDAETGQTRAAMIWAQFCGLTSALALTDDPALRGHRDLVVAAYGRAMQSVLEDS